MASHLLHVVSASIERGTFLSALKWASWLCGAGAEGLSGKKVFMTPFSSGSAMVIEVVAA